MQTIQAYEWEWNCKWIIQHRWEWNCKWIWMIMKLQMTIQAIIKLQMKVWERLTDGQSPYEDSDFRGFDSSRILISRGGILMSTGNFPEIFGCFAGVSLESLFTSPPSCSWCLHVCNVRMAYPGCAQFA